MMVVVMVSEMPGCCKCQCTCRRHVTCLMCVLNWLMSLPRQAPSLVFITSILISQMRDLTHACMTQVTLTQHGQHGGVHDLEELGV
jgi:hypothetical protein